jgi:hypothetical protein
VLERCNRTLLQHGATPLQISSEPQLWLELPRTEIAGRPSIAPVIRTGWLVARTPLTSSRACSYTSMAGLGTSAGPSCAISCRVSRSRSRSPSFLPTILHHAGSRQPPPARLRCLGRSFAAPRATVG